MQLIQARNTAFHQKGRIHLRRLPIAPNFSLALARRTIHFRTQVKLITFDKTDFGYRLSSPLNLLMYRETGVPTGAYSFEQRLLSQSRVSCYSSGVGAGDGHRVSPYPPSAR